MCINAGAWPDGKVESDRGGVLKDGQVYHVEDVFFSDGYIWYVVDDGLNEPDMGYWENCFARLSNDKKEEEKDHLQEFEHEVNYESAFKKFVRTILQPRKTEQ